MNWEDKEIDALFKSAKAPEAPAFQESFWTEMEALLPPVKKRRAAAFWWFSGTSAAVLVVALLWFFAPAGRDAQQLASGTEKPVAPAEQQSIENKLNGNGSAGTTAAPLNEQQTAVSAQEMPHQSLNRRTKGEAEVTPDERIIAPEAPLAQEEIASVAEEASVRVENLPLLPLTAGGSRIPSGKYLPPVKPERFYLQACAGIGQSALRNVDGRSDLLHYYALGGGLYQRVGQMYLSFGIQGRMDVAQNIVHTDQLANNGRNEIRYAQLYSFETPFAIGFRTDNNSFGITVAPGFQSGYTGRFTEYTASGEVVRSGKATGRTEQSKTLTMEIGLSYMRTLCPNWYLGCSVNVDAISPYGDGSFYGENRMLPLNGNVLLRRTF